MSQKEQESDEGMHFQLDVISKNIRNDTIMYLQGQNIEKLLYEENQSPSNNQQSPLIQECKENNEIQEQLQESIEANQPNIYSEHNDFEIDNNQHSQIDQMNFNENQLHDDFMFDDQNQLQLKQSDEFNNFSNIQQKGQVFSQSDDDSSHFEIISHNETLGKVNRETIKLVNPTQIYDKEQDQAEKNNQSASRFWQKFKCLQSDANLQLVAMEKIKSLILEIIQCERNYEAQLRRIGLMSKQLQKNFLNTNQQQNQSLQSQQESENGFDKQKLSHQHQQDIHCSIYNNMIQCLQTYCTEKANLVELSTMKLQKNIFNTILKVHKENAEILKQQNKEGNGLIKDMRDLIHRVQFFNDKYKSMIVDPKQKPGTLDKFINKMFGTSKQANTKLNIHQQPVNNMKKNISDFQKDFINRQNQNNIFNILDESTEIKNNMKRTFLTEQVKLVKESDQIRKNYSIKMQNCINIINFTMSVNLEKMIQAFEQFYQLGVEIVEESTEKINTFKSNFNKMSIKESYQKYMNNEIPEYDPKWITNDFPFNQLNSEKIEDFQSKMSLYIAPRKQTQNFNELHESHCQIQKNIENNQFLKNNEEILNKILVKAWHGNEGLIEEDKNKFVQVVRFKQGQILFVHLLNQFRVKQQKIIRNEVSMESLQYLINKVLDENINDSDTSIAINCHILASTYYLPIINVTDTTFQSLQYSSKNNQNLSTKSEFLFERIKTHPIWKNMRFWEKTLSQFVQDEIIQKISESKENQNQTISNMESMIDLDNNESLMQRSQSSLINTVQDQTAQSLPDILQSKLLQLQNDMLSFQVPIQQIKQLLAPFLKPSNQMLEKQQIKDIKFLLEIEEQKLNEQRQDLFRQKKLLNSQGQLQSQNEILKQQTGLMVDDQLFDANLHLNKKSEVIFQTAQFGKFDNYQYQNQQEETDQKLEEDYQQNQQNQY